MPYIAERLWQNVTTNNFQDRAASVHLEAWPELVALSIKEKEVLEQMTLSRQAAELGLAARDKEGIKIRQMLAKAEFKGGTKLGEEYINLLMDELNIQTITWLEGEGNLEVELDLNITPELKLEGYKRELIRTINLLRKDASLTASDVINISLTSDNDLVSILSSIGEDLKKATIAESISLKALEKSLVSKDLKLDEMKITVAIDKLA